MAFRGLKRAPMQPQKCPKTLQERSKRGPGGDVWGSRGGAPFKMAPRGAQETQTGPKMAPRGPQYDPKRPQ
eukprot:1109647-Pyramimonas_sp.AAC.1